MKILNWEEIQNILKKIDLFSNQEQGFVAYSQGKAIVPPVGHLNIEEFEGECHIKFGYIQGDSVFVIKTATSFPRNLNLGLLSGNGTKVSNSFEQGNHIEFNEQKPFADLPQILAAPPESNDWKDYLSLPTENR